MLKKQLLEAISHTDTECAFIIRNLKTGQVWSHREKEYIRSESLIKVFIMMEAVKRIKNGSLSVDSEIPVQADDVVPFSVLEFIKPRNYHLEELLRLMIVYSDNTATNVLMDFLGTGSINSSIRDAGFEKSVLQRKMMDFGSAEEGRENYTTPEEMADFMERLYEQRMLGGIYDDLMLDIMKGQCDETMMREHLPDEIIIARKSGELDGLNHDIAIVYGEKCDYIYAFFVWGACSNNEARAIIGDTSKIVYDFMNVID